MKEQQTPLLAINNKAAARKNFAFNGKDVFAFDIDNKGVMGDISLILFNNTNYTSNLIQERNKDYEIDRYIYFDNLCFPDLR